MLWQGIEDQEEYDYFVRSSQRIFKPEALKAKSSVLKGNEDEDFIGISTSNKDQ
jgi:hypothetical protein